MMKKRYFLEQFAFRFGKENADFEQFRAKNTDWSYLNELDDQYRELYAIRHPGAQHGGEEGFKQWMQTFHGDAAAGVHGQWIIYPWLTSAVLLLPEDLFFEVRTARNRYKIFEEEQAVLRTKTVAVMGLSIGSAVAMTLAMERVGGTLRVADFDTLGLSNLNRLRAGVHQLGMAKSEIFARAALELDPYLTIEAFESGISPENLGAFLEGADVLIELTDAFALKMLARVEARKRGIPVVMETNERGLLDIERFDLEPQRPYFHGLVPESWVEHFKDLTAEQRQEFVLKLVNFHEGSKRGQHSFMEVGKSINSWPQLASAVMVGAGATVDSVRKILLGLSTVSGRFYVDLDAIIPED